MGCKNILYAHLRSTVNINALAYINGGVPYVRVPQTLHTLLTNYTIYTHIRKFFGRERRIFFFGRSIPIAVAVSFKSVHSLKRERCCSCYITLIYVHTLSSIMFLFSMYVVLRTYAISLEDQVEKEVLPMNEIAQWRSSIVIYVRCKIVGRSCMNEWEDVDEKNITTTIPVLAHTNSYSLSSTS